MCSEYSRYSKYKNGGVGMRYLYDELKKALGGKVVDTSKTTVIKNWTPNNIRILIITRNCIVVVKHIGQAVQYNLDSNLFFEDLEQAGYGAGRNDLTNLLRKRSLSCLEEIYVDGVFQNYPSVMDINKYANESIAKSSRLRYYGYIKSYIFDIAGYIRSTEISRNVLYTLAKDENRKGKIDIMCSETGVENWYEKHYLRPQYYQMDNPKGNLAIHFNKVERYCKEIEGKLEEEKTANALMNIIKSIIAKDEINIASLDSLYIITGFLSRNKDDEVNGMVLNTIVSCVKKYRSGNRISGFYEDIARKLTDSYHVLNTYSAGKMDVYDHERGNTLNVNSLKDKMNGFLPIGVLLDDICCTATDELRKKKKIDTIGMALTMCGDEIPNGKLRDSYLNGVESGTEDLHGYIKYLCELCGMNYDYVYKA